MLWVFAVKSFKNLQLLTSLNLVNKLQFTFLSIFSSMWINSDCSTPVDWLQNSLSLQACSMVYFNDPELDRYFSIVRINYLPVDLHLSVITSGGWRRKLYPPWKLQHIDALLHCIKVLYVLSQALKMFIRKFRSVVDYCYQLPPQH